MGATERIKQYLDIKGISKYKFYQKTGFSNKFLDNSSNMGTDRAEIILHHYPDINPEWLLTGKGKMLKEEIAPVQPRPTIINKECELCKEKDKLIYSQQKNIKLLEDRVETLTVHLQSKFFTHFPTNYEKS